MIRLFCHDAPAHEQTSIMTLLKNRPHFGEVADDVRSLFVDLGEDVEDKRLHVKIKRLVVQK